MKSKKLTENGAKNPRGKQAEKRRALSLFPTNIWSLSGEECAKLSFKPDGLAETIIEALQKHGVEAGEARKMVVQQVKTKFAQAHDSTIRTQVYRGIAYLRAVPHR
jgi:hypothetical protein